MACWNCQPCWRDSPQARLPRWGCRQGVSPWETAPIWYCSTPQEPPTSVTTGYREATIVHSLGKLHRGVSATLFAKASQSIGFERSFRLQSIDVKLRTPSSTTGRRHTLFGRDDHNAWHAALL